MKTAGKIFDKYWFFAAIAIAAWAAFEFGEVSVKINEWNLLKIGIFLSFFLTSLRLDTSHITEQCRNFKAIAAAMISCFVLFPLVGRGFAMIDFGGNSDILVGICILSVVPVTLASGTILTTLAGGNVPFSLMINICAHTLSIFTIPISLKLLLASDETIELPAVDIMIKIALMVLLPVFLGQVARIKVKAWIGRFSKACSIFCQLVILLIIFNAIASSTAKMADLGYKIVYIMAAMLALHIVIVAMNFGISRLLRFDRPLTSAFTLHTSQKTLGLSYIVWFGFFKSFPLAMIPIICYHLVQLVADTYLAHYFANIKKEK